MLNCYLAGYRCYWSAPSPKLAQQLNWTWIRSLMSPLRSRIRHACRTSDGARGSRQYSQVRVTGSVAVKAIDRLTQTQPRLVKAMLDRPERVASDLGDLFVSKIREVLKQKHLALVSRQLLCGTLNRVPQLGTQWFPVGAPIGWAVLRRPAALVEFPPVELIFDGLRYSRRVKHRQLCRAPPNPSVEVRLGSKLIQVQVRGEEARLRDVQRTCFRSSHLQRQAIDIVPVSLNEFLERTHVALLCSREKL